MNEQDSLQMGGILSRLGYGKTEDPLQADFILFVTCSIREKSVHKVYSELGKLKPYIENNPQLVVGLSGCVAQQEKGNLFKRFPYLDLVFGPDAISSLPSMLEEVRLKKGSLFPAHLMNTRLHTRKDFDFVNLVAEDENRVRAFVNIQKGCDNVCAFCIVPYVRGREVSRPSDEILREVSMLVDMGVREVTLLGQNVNSYGIKDTDELKFSGLLEKIATQTKIERLRFTTSHPKDVGDDLIEKFASLPNLCPHFHLPVQSGSTKILEAMGRQYTRGQYLEIVSKLKKVRPGISLTTDIIVGFPGETEDDFKQTLSLVEEAGFDLSYSFVYSPRPYTSAIKLGDDISTEEKNRRLNLLLEKQRQVSRENNIRFLGTRQEVLVETWDVLGQAWMGRTPTNKIVHFKTNDLSLIKNADHLIGNLRQVVINHTNPHSLLGELDHGTYQNEGNGADHRPVYQHAHHHS